MSTHVPDRTAAKILLDAEALGRTLSRIAHEIIERNDDLGRLALVGIHTRGVPLAERLAALIEERSGEEVALGAVDITFHRDDTRPGRGAARRPRDRARLRPPRARPCVLVDDVLYTGRTIRAAIETLFEHGRPARVQLAVLVDRGHRELPIRPDYVGKNLPTARSERIQVELEETDGADRILLVARARRSSDEAPALDRRPDPRRRRADPRDGRCARGEIDEKLPTLRGKLVLNLFFESSTRTSSSFELAAKRLSADVMSLKAAGSSVDKGESLKDTVLTLARTSRTRSSSATRRSARRSSSRATAARRS